MNARGSPLSKILNRAVRACLSTTIGDKRLAELLSSDEDPAGNFDEVAKLLGQSGKPPKL
ncbi:hypothetical protein [Nitrobacter winogradskyi]|uniref:Uncharacterized protein n=2 Tax=Nitrobacter winogradskyi TaxID=913 RepID=A0ACC6AG53_NITWI|nr:hypothetical protein [Nitrobacter winogradskyi]MCP1998842.1 hypothetical protein [Nitrobacter winogradskyi]GEC14237.1 hypothetical protein NWI01_01290 [Nitrobacter winogradskyi]